MVVLHLPAGRKSLLPEILSRWTTMPVIEVDSHCQVEPGCIYVPRPGSITRMEGDRLLVSRPVMGDLREHAPIDVFFNSLALHLGEEAVGIVLSGTGSDGALGLKAIKEHGGLTLAQGVDGTAPMYPGMPDSAVATGAVDLVVSAEAMAGHILALYRERWTAGDEAEITGPDSNEIRLAICAVLLRQTGHDFSHYKDKTFLRRVQRRMLVLAIGEMPAYAERLQGDRAEAFMLFRDLLIGVTSFFRDEETFAILEQEVMPKLFNARRSDMVVRVWVPGCATGEEAYSLAILLQEYADRMPSPAPHVQVFATDIDEGAIATARAGRYPSVLLQRVTPERRARFFVEGAEGSYTVARDLRAICTFSAHSLTRDPPFSRIDLVSCRNLLIYLDSELQSAIIPAFHYSLVPGGILLLGSSETVSRHETLFAPLDRTHRIYVRLEGPSPPPRLFGGARRGEPSPRFAEDSGHVASGRRDAGRSGSRAVSRVLERYAPPFVVVTEDANIVQYSSRTGRYLEPVPGSPTQNALVLARRGLRMPLQLALRRAVETRRPAERADILVSAPGGEPTRVKLMVEPMLEQAGLALYLVVFIETPAGEGAARVELAEPGDGQTTRLLEAELSETREQLQAITEEHDTALEELRSANEELHSVNEELQSTNEELETSKEEIQSINEELQAANAQLSGNVDELDRKNSDLQNLFESTQVATIFLDPYLVIRGFTPAVAAIYNLIPSDIGRPLTDIATKLRYATLREDVKHVLAKLEPLERRVARDDGGAHYLMRILPYRAPDSTVDGTLVTFVDVTTIVQAEEHQRLLVDELNHRVKNMLTVVISMATQTMRRSQTMEDFSKDYLGRVHALATAYSLLSNQGWQTVSLQHLLMEELSPFEDRERVNVAVSGPHVLLEPRAALALGMAVHELTTNAVKYGALSVPEGTVSVTWSVRDADARPGDGRPGDGQPGDGRADGGEAEPGQLLDLQWEERDGPPVVAPLRRGFGTVMIERGLTQDMSAKVSLEFPRTGVIAKICAPLRHRAVNDSASAGVDRVWQ